MRSIYLILVSVISFCALGQKPVSMTSAINQSTLTVANSSNDPCGFDHAHNKMMQIDPTYAFKVQANESKIAQQKRSRIQKSGSVDTIPIVVHIIHTGQAVGSGANISLTQINSAITELNNKYKNANSQGVDTDIYFELAKRDPNGNATTGINRVDGSVLSGYSTAGVNASGSSGASEIDVKNLSRWPNTQYYNVWVVTEIDDNNGLFGVQGYAYFPGASPSVDGTIIMHTCFGTTGTVNSFNNLNRTFVHELGHGLNLYHTFEGDSSGFKCPSGNGDFVADTDPHIRASSDCPSGTNSCTGNSIDDETANYMNYSSQSCAIKFTAGQKTRMQSALDVGRPSLVSSLGNKSPASSSVTSATCTPSTTNTNNGFGLGIYEFNFSNVFVVSDGTVDEGDYIDQTKHQLISVKSDTSYTISIETGPANNEDVVVFIDFNNDGDFADANETVFSSNTAINHSGSISIPNSGFTPNTLLRMRVISDFHSFTISGSCYNPTYGQTEDYAIIIEDNISASISTTASISCNGQSNGALSAIASGGSTPYTYAWSNSVSSQNNTNLSAGTYTVTVTDNAGSSATASATLSQPSTLSATISASSDISCNGGADGSITSSASGGTSPYTYGWTNGQSTATASGLTAGIYTVTITDNNNCTATDQKTLREPTAITTSLTVNDATCNGSSDGSITSNTIGGSSPYTYSWSNGVSLSTNANLTAGTYTITITDGAGCTISQNATVNQQSAISISLSSNNVSCGNTSDGSISSTVFGGVSPYNYTWSTGSTLANLSSLGTGSYSVTVTDNNGCSNTSSISVLADSCTNIDIRLRSIDCGASDVDPINRTIVAIKWPNTTAYRFRINGGSLSNFVLNTGSDYYFKTSQVAGLTYGTTYTVEVAGFINGNWSNYGTACNITTSSIANAVNFKLRSFDCGATNVDPLNRLIVATNRTDATEYRFRFNGGSLNNFILNTGSNYYFRTSQITGLSYGTTYTVEVAGFINGSWTNYGTACNITTSSIATAINLKLRSIDCGASNVDPINKLIVSTNRADITAYRFRFNGGTLTNFVLNTGSDYFFRTSQIAGLSYGTTYTVEVAGFINGSWSNYGTVCNITTMNVADVPSLRLRSFDCGATNVDLQNRLIVALNRSDATAYRFRFNGGSLSNFVLNTGSDYFFRTSQVTGLASSTTYNVEVAAFISGSWTNYGTVCTITTEASPAPPMSFMRVAKNAEENQFDYVKFNIFPNPSNAQPINISYSREGELKNTVTLRIYSITGSLVYEDVVNSEQLEVKYELDPSIFTDKGIYMVFLHDGDRSFTEKLIIQ